MLSEAEEQKPIKEKPCGTMEVSVTSDERSFAGEERGSTLVMDVAEQTHKSSAHGQGRREDEQISH